MSLTQGETVLVDAHHEPVLYEVFSLWLQLEPLSAEDEDRFAHAASIIEAWVGAELRTSNDGYGDDTPYRGVTAWMARTPLMLDYAVSPYPSPARKMASTRVGYRLRCRGKEGRRASPWSTTIRSRIPHAGESDLSVSTHLHVTVPNVLGAADLRTRALELVTTLRVRWGCAGLGYSVVMNEPKLALERMHAHSRAHPGYDLTCELDPLWDRALRSVSWLTIIGRGLTGIDLDDPTFTELSGITSERLPGALVLQAGELPVRGDMNRLQLPEAYVAVDRALRKVRAKQGTTFPAPWRADTGDHWLKRFERVVV